MEHGEQVTHAKGFGHNTSGVGLLIVAIVAVCLALFCWNFWKDGSREIDHYRLNSQPAHSADHGASHGEAGVTEAKEASHTEHASAGSEAATVDSLAKTEAITDSSKHADSTHH